MEEFTATSVGAKTYSERVIYEGILADLDGYGSNVSDGPYGQRTVFKKEKFDISEENEDSRLYCVMNDHNYMLSCKEETISVDMRQNLIDYVKTNSSSVCTNSDDTPIEKLIDNILSLLSKATDFDSAIQKIEEAVGIKSPPFAKTELVEDQNLAQHENSDFLADIDADIKSVLEALIKEEENDDEADRANICSEVEKKSSEERCDDPLSVLDDPSDSVVPKIEVIGETKCTEGEELAKSPKNIVSQINLPIPNVQKPEEIIQEVKKNDTEKSEEIPSEKSEMPESSKIIPDDLPDVLKKLLVFAEKLKEDCINEPGKSEFNLESFLASKSQEYKIIVNSTLCVDNSVQTEKVISKKKLRKINAQDKRLLLESSNDSDSSTSSDNAEETLEYGASKSISSDIQSCNASKESLSLKKSKRNVKYFNSDSDSDDECAKSDLSESDDSMCSTSKNGSNNMDQTGSNSDNDKDKGKEKEKIESPVDRESDHKTEDKPDQSAGHNHDKSRGKGTNESDKENRSFVESPKTGSVNKSKQDEKVDEDNQEKEIERLLNLKSLNDPQKNSSLSNNLKPLKASSKSSSKTDSLYAVMQELDGNSLSDDSGSEKSEKILTEKQFLVKCNENLKQQLLNSASSDSDNFNSDTDIDLIKKINDPSGDEDENRLSYVDKFLETLVDNEENSPANSSDISKVSTPDKAVCKKTKDKNETNEKPLSPSSTTDPYDFGFKKKESPPIDLESMLSMDKRQKVVTINDDPIDLSGDSSNSDVEECPSEEKDKTARIKPMLRKDQLESETISAQKKEAERLRRLEKKNTYLTKLLKSKNENIDEKDLILDYVSVNKKFIKVHPDIVKHLKPHQRDGVKFMYDSCYGCIDSSKENTGSGCILAHCMGLGKTLQIIALLHTVTSYKELKTSKILVLCPKSTIMNWADEIQRWLGPLEEKIIQIFNFSDTADIYEKINVLRRWSVSSLKAGCLIMGYEAFRSLVFFNSNKNRANPIRVEDIRKSIHKFLLKPGADLVVCDEGHIIKNRKSGISLAAAEIVTPKRIVLTGTPIQNNLKEYYSMVNFIKPLILGTEKEFANLYANPIKNGQHKDSSKRDIKVMKQRSFVLHKKLSKFVQRKEAELLQSFLPQKFEYVLFIPMSDVQNTLYEYVLEAISKREDSRGRSLITDYTCLRKIWTHPKVLEDAWKNAMVAKNKKEVKRQSSLAHSDDDQPDDIYDSQTGVISVQRDWWRSYVTDSDLETIVPSNKLKTMFEIIRMAEENAFVAVLNVVEYFFHKINDKQRDLFAFDRSSTDKPTGSWINGQDYYRLDGKTNKTIRHEMVKRFNDPKNKRARVFLISAKAGGQGINLIGANRVIILDTSWNPANDQQNIFRIFRLGQKRNCYVYRLIAMGTMEEKVYSRSVTKQAMSFRVVDEQQIDRHYNMAELAELYTLTKPCYNERPVPVFPQDQILANLLLNFPDLVYKYHEHDSLLENKEEQQLSEQDKADAWVAYERDLQMNSEPREIMEGYQGYPIFGQPNYMYPMGDYDPKNFMPGNADLSQLEMAARNPLGSSLLPNYMTSRNSYLDILNMYKNFSTSLMNDKNSRVSRFNTNYPMPLAPGMMNNAALCNALSSNESHLSALTNPFFQLHTLANASNAFSNNPLGNSAMMSNPNLPSSNVPGVERFEQNKNLMPVDDNIVSSMRNFPAPMPPFAKDLTGRSALSKTILPSPPSGTSRSPVLHSPSLQLPKIQNVFNGDVVNDIIPRNIIPKRRGKPTSRVIPIPDTGAKNKTSESLFNESARQTLGLHDLTMKPYEPPPVPIPVNMGIVYPKQPQLPSSSPSPASEKNEGSCNIMTTGNSMQIIPTHSPLTENVRKKFDNISPNISLTAVRTLPKPMQSEQLQPTSSPNHVEAAPSNIRKRRNSLGTSQQGNDRKQRATEQPNYPPKVSKF